MKEMPRSNARRPWLLAATLTAVAAVVSLAIWSIYIDSNRPANDCTTVENLGVQWSAMVALVEAANDRALDTAGSENDSDSVGSQTAMGTKLRATADTVSKPEIKQALLSWASVAEKSAQLQRYLSKHPDTPISEVQSHTQENVILLDQATGSLAQMCPGLPAALAPSKG